MFNKRKIIIIISILVVLTAVVVIVFVKFRKSDKIPASKTSIQSAQIEKNKQQNFNSIIENTSKTDKDFDGLLDADEIKRGTNPAKSDTDNDGLLDGDEINIYKTNPLKADTDGDGHMDGIEVRNNYNPNGTGKFL